ncbi:MAG: hypothetical protein CMJ19_17615 [Phycisphaeraceae bacterium]|nr:hypothetical protein [Phycisphaeraceae bacterium]
MRQMHFIISLTLLCWTFLCCSLSAREIGFETTEGYNSGSLDGQPSSGTQWIQLQGTDAALKVNSSAGDVTSDYGIQNSTRTNNTPCVYQYLTSYSNDDLGGRFLSDSSELSYHLRFCLNSTSELDSNELFTMILGQNSTDKIALRLVVRRNGTFEFYHSNTSTAVNVKDKLGNNFSFAEDNSGRYINIKGTINYATNEFTLVADNVVQISSDGSSCFPFVSSLVDQTYPQIILQDNNAISSPLVYKLDDLYLNHISTRFVVSTSGLSTNPGTYALPTTIAHALTLVQPGDTIMYKEGDYIGIDIRYLCGTADAPITVMAEPGKNVRFTSVPVGSQNGIRLLGCEWVIVDGFEVVGSTSVINYGAAIKSCKNCVLQNCMLHHVGIVGLKIGKAAQGVDQNELDPQGAVYTIPSENIYILNNEIYDTYCNGSGYSYGEGIYIGQGGYTESYRSTFPDNSRNIFVIGNEIYETKAEGINIKSETFNSICEYNHVHDGICDVGGNGGIHVEGIRNGPTHTLSQGDQPAYLPYSHRGHVIRYNLIHDFSKVDTTYTSGVGISLQGAGATCYGNVCYLNQDRGIVVGGYPGVDLYQQQIDAFHNTMFNNYDVSLSKPDLYISSICNSANVYSNNLGQYINYHTSYFPYSNNLSAVVADFRDPNNVDKEKASFQLQQSSTAIDHSSCVSQENLMLNGVLKNDVPWDMQGVIRPSGSFPDMGAYEYVDLNSDLCGWWPLNQRVGKLVLDHTKYNNKGTIVGSPKQKKGRIGSAMAFNGINDGVQVPYNVNLNGASFAITAWVCPEKPLTKRAIISSSSGMSGGYRLMIINNTSVFRWYLVLAKGSGWEYIGSPVDMPVVPNRWTHLAATYDATTGNVCLFVNGVRVTGPWSKSYVPNAASIFCIGKRSDTSEFKFKGMIDDVRVYSRALTESEILDIMVPDHYDCDEDFTNYEFNSSSLPNSWSAGKSYNTTEAEIIQSGSCLTVVSSNTPTKSSGINLSQDLTSISPASASTKRITQALTFGGPFTSNRPYTETTSKPYIKMVLCDSTNTEKEWSYNSHRFLCVHVHRYSNGGVYFMLSSKNATSVLYSKVIMKNERDGYAPEAGDQLIAVYNRNAVEKVYLHKSASGQDLLLFENWDHHVDWSAWTLAYTHLIVGNNVLNELQSSISFDRIVTRVD